MSTRMMIRGTALTSLPLLAGGCEGSHWAATIGAIPMGLWTLLFVAALVAVFVSVQSAVVGLLYAAGRPGNDDLPTRDQWLARRAATGGTPAPAPEGSAS